MRASEIVRAVIDSDGTTDMQDALLDMFLKPVNESLTSVLMHMLPKANNATAKPVVQELKFRDPQPERAPTLKNPPGRTLTIKNPPGRVHPFTAQVKQMALEGMPQWKIAANLRLGANTVLKILNELGLRTIRTRNKPLSDDEGIKILELHERGSSITDIAVQVNISPTSVSNFLRGNHPLSRSMKKGR